ncbi:MAG TPA: hypothetical protein VF189_02435, partial [Patescibacteria group bacterium]
MKKIFNNNGKRILIIDNNPYIREALKALLQEENFRVETTDIVHCPNKLKRDRLDIAIADISYLDFE